MTGWLIAAVIVFDLGIGVTFVWGVVHFMWGHFAAAHPPRPPAADAVTRTFQSFRLGLLSLGFAIHVTADEAHLHLQPVRFLRWLGARAASIPWERITIVKRGRSGRWCTARIGSHTLQGPSWCLALAEPDQTA